VAVRAGRAACSRIGCTGGRQARPSRTLSSVGKPGLSRRRLVTAWRDRTTPTSVSGSCSGQGSRPSDPDTGTAGPAPAWRARWPARHAPTTSGSPISNRHGRCPCSAPAGQPTRSAASGERAPRRRRTVSAGVGRTGSPKAVRGRALRELIYGQLSHAPSSSVWARVPSAKASATAR